MMINDEQKINYFIRMARNKSYKTYWLRLAAKVLLGNSNTLTT